MRTILVDMDEIMEALREASETIRYDNTESLEDLPDLELESDDPDEVDEEIEKHLQGQHDQLSHGRRGGGMPRAYGAEMTEEDAHEIAATAFEMWKGDPTAMRREMNKSLNDEPPSSGVEGEERMYAVAGLYYVATKSETQNRPMYRGVNLTGKTHQDVLDQFPAGTDFWLGPQGFSSNEGIAHKFMGVDVGAVPVLYQVKPGSKMLPIERFENNLRPPSRRSSQWKRQGDDQGESEHVGAGRFRVVSSKDKRIAFGRSRVRVVIVDIEQVEGISNPKDGFQ